MTELPALTAKHVAISLRRGVGEILVDGRDIAHGVTDLTLTVGARRPAALVVELAVFLVRDVQVDGEAITTVRMPDATRDALIALGWTPPQEAP